jgi:hypothetical protein
MEIITGIERRRRWSAEEKLRIVAEIERADGGIVEIARRYEISRGLREAPRTRHRRKVGRVTRPTFLPALHSGFLDRYSIHHSSPIARASQAASGGPHSLQTAVVPYSNDSFRVLA